MIVGELNGVIKANYSILYFKYCPNDVHASSSWFEGFSVFTGTWEVGQEVLFFAIVVSF
ncbi:hypothetical protein [Vagococcus silagei]|uniref:hypothetical protein n=1 Tax=Vagococcus silagei TaxID=2508885 RepID=UPI0013A5F554|nr:hypothetical protein [Vagococcus silagei]